MGVGNNPSIFIGVGNDPVVLEVADNITLNGDMVTIETYINLGCATKMFSSYNIARLMALESKFF